MTMVAEGQNHKQESGVGQVLEMQFGRIKNGNDQNAAQVIGYGQGGQKYLQADGNPFAEHGEYPQ